MALRKAIRGLSEPELTNFREAISRAKALSDERGYNYFAGVHGLPLPSHCEHGTLLFLPWHRAYLYFFELALQDQVQDVALPYWDWSADISHQEGLPAAYSDEQDDGGLENPLFSSTVEWDQALIDFVLQRLPGALTQDGQTLRDPDPPDELPRKDTIDSILDAPTFEDFSTRLENVHGDVHVWVGGAMSAVPTAGYDPIFFAHHSMIDRLWYLWQMRHTGMSLPPSLMQVALPPFPVTVAQTLNIETLGYEYAVQSFG
ncbi:MAG: tyrosinase family protein [Rubrobacteraceae bacterium]